MLTPAPFDREQYRQELAEQFIRNSDAFVSPDGRSSFTLDPHQVDAMEQGIYALGEGRDRFSIVHAGGAGKSVLEAGMVQASQRAKVKLNGTLANTQDIVLAVERSLVGGIREHLATLGLDVGVWGGGERILDRPVLVTTIQALQHNRNHLGRVLNLSNISLLIGDEADRLITHRRREITERFRNAQRIGLTATPEWPDGRHINLAWGDIIHNLSLKESIRRGVNVPPLYTLYEANFNTEDIAMQEGDFDPKALGAALKAIEIETAIAEIYEGMIPENERNDFPTLVYLPNVDTVQRVTEKLQTFYGSQGLNITSWTGKTTNDQLRQDTNDFHEGRINILVLCAMGGRGLNLPRARALIDGDPTLSATKLEQRHSRIFRRIRPGTSFDRAGFQKPFAHIAQILPRSHRFRPLTLLDILDCWPDYRPGRVIGLPDRGESSGSEGDRGPAFREEVDRIVRHMQEHHRHGLQSRVTLIERADVLHEIQRKDQLPQADEDGFFEIDGARYGTVKAWTKILSISFPTVQSHLQTSQKQGIPGKDPSGHVQIFYSESDVREVCADLLEEGLFQADNSGFFEKDGQNYGTIRKWGRHLKRDAGIIKRRLQTFGKQGILGKSDTGIQTFYSESDVREACADLLKDLPQADDSGFFEKDGQRYGTCGQWKKTLGIKDITIKKRLEVCQKQGIRGKDSTGQIQTFYSESDVREVCADLLSADLPRAGKDGFFEKDGERYGTLKAWGRILPITDRTIASYLKEAKKQGIFGKLSKGNIYIFYSESDVREVCADLLSADLPRAGKDGFFEKDDERYGTLEIWRKSLDIHTSTIERHLKLTQKQGILGRSNTGIRTFYSESDVREVCADLLAKRK